MTDKEIKELKSRFKKCDPQKPYIFISYSQCDAERVYPVVLELQQRGCNVWIDSCGLEMKLGENWQDPALDSIADENCYAVFFMISSDSLKSAPVFAEIMWSQKGISVKRNHDDNGVSLKIIDVDPNCNLANGKIKETVKSKISKDKEKLDDVDYKTMKYIEAIDSYVYEGRNKVKTKGNLAYEFYMNVFEKLLGGGGNILLGDCKDVETIVKNVPQECFTSIPGDSTAEDVKLEAAEPTVKAEREKSVITFPNGDVYEGEIEDGKPDGQGKMTYFNGIIYEGEFKSGKPDGLGKVTYAEAFYEGEFKDGKPNGQGRIKHANGNIYEGEYKNGKPNGHGKMTYSNGETAEGEWEKGKFKG